MNHPYNVCQFLVCCRPLVISIVIRIALIWFAGTKCSDSEWMAPTVETALRIGMSKLLVAGIQAEHFAKKPHDQARGGKQCVVYKWAGQSFSCLGPVRFTFF